MHEFALAEAVIATALRAADEHGMTTVERIDVAVGELQQIRRETFEFALKEVLPASEPRIADTTIQVDIEPARFLCRPCGRAFTRTEAGDTSLDEGEAIHFIPELAHSFLRCPDCGSPDFEVVAGRGVSIRRIEGDDSVVGAPRPGTAG